MGGCLSRRHRATRKATRATRAAGVAGEGAARAHGADASREFAAAFHLPLTTLRDWEQRRSVPDAPARALLLAIERDPKRMLALLAG